MNTKKSPLVSIVIPAKDEAENIDTLLKRLKKILAKFPNYKKSQFEIIVVCDNCSDKTEKIAKFHQAKVIRRINNPGKSKALIAGFKKAQGQLIVMMDADLSHLPEDLPKLIKKFRTKKNLGLVIASRELGGSGDATRVREFGGKLFNKLVNLFFGTNLTDAINGYKVFQKHIFDNFEYKSTGYAIEIELIANTVRSGMKILEVASFEPKRAGGVAKSKIVKDGWIFLWEIITEGLNYRYHKLYRLVSGY